MLPEYVGPCALGIKMGLVLRASDLAASVIEALRDVESDGLLSDGDAVCITESIVARAQDNYVGIEELAEKFRRKLSIARDGRIGVVFPIMSRNRFSPVLEAIAAAVPQGEVIVQLSYPDDEVGNQLIPAEAAVKLEKKIGDCILPADLDRRYPHPLTGVDYTELYRSLIEKAGASAQIILCNDPVRILEYAPDGIIAADIHTREQTREKLHPVHENVITLQDVCSQPDEAHAWSEWGLLGSNMASGGKLKLAPHDCNGFAASVQECVKGEFNKNVEVIIYGDGAYKDPTSGIYELADPCAAFGATSGLNRMLRTGIKLKLMVDIYQEQGKSEEEIRNIVEREAIKRRKVDSIESEGTTPRRMQDLLASLADLVSGSADAGTPVVLAKGFLDV